MMQSTFRLKAEKSKCNLRNAVSRLQFFALPFSFVSASFICFHTCSLSTSFSFLFGFLKSCILQKKKKNVVLQSERCTAEFIYIAFWRNACILYDTG